MVKFNFLIIFTAIIVFTVPSWAVNTDGKNVPEFLFGPEFTFGIYFQNGEVRSVGEHRMQFYELMHKRMRTHLIDNQPDGEKFGELAGYFTSPMGWEFQITRDEGVIEVRMSPLTLKDYKRYQADIQDAIFASAANEGAFPAMFAGGGHLNIGFKEFDGNMLLFRNFIVDYYNHNELSFGIMNYDMNNAPPLEHSGFSRQFVEAINAESRYEADYIYSTLCGVLNNKSFALSLYNVCSESRRDDMRIEIRAIRPQQSIEMWVRQIELFQKRLEYLAQFDYPIPYKPKLKVKAMSILEVNEVIESRAPIRYNSPVNPQEAFMAFYEYVTESGLEWQDHRDYVWPMWVTDGELEKFENSQWFKNKEQFKSGSKKGNCISALS